MTWSNESPSKRGLGARWKRLRLSILERDNYLCQCERCLGGKLRLTPANEVNHRVPRAWFLDGRASGDPDDPANLHAVSGDCHKRITIEQQGKRPGRRFDARGYPIDAAPRGGRSTS